jgi:glycerophosphoryl diester phosphodiesterase
VIFSSFNPIALRRIRRLIPEAPIGLLAHQGSKGWLARSWLGYLLRYHSLHPAAADAIAALIERVQRRGSRVYVYTVNQQGEMQRLFALGVDGIFTDDPLLAQKSLKEFRSKTSRSRKEISR